MHIGIDASRSFIKEKTGTENYSYQLIRALAKIDKANQYTLYLRPNQERQNSNLSGLLNLSFDPSNFEFKIINQNRLWTQLGLAKEVWFNPPDVLFIPSHTLPVFKKSGLKTVVTIHDLGYEYLPQYHQFPQKLYLNKSTEWAVSHADHLIAVSQATKKDLQSKLNCPPGKITVIYEGYDKKKFKPLAQKGINQVLAKYKITPPYFLFVGTLQPRKNIVRLIEAFAYFLKDNPSAKNTSLIIGGGKGWFYQEILEAPFRFNVSDAVRFLGFTPEEDLPGLYSGTLCFCLPSLFEGFGLPVLEAMACASPVLVSDTSSLPEVSGQAGVSANPLDVQEIASGLGRVYNNLTFRKKLSSESLKQAAKFSWEKAARETLEVLEKVDGR